MLTPPKNPNLYEDELDELFHNAVNLICKYDKASPSLLQRKLSIGYARAARLMDQLELVGVIGPFEGAKPRDVLITSYEDFLKTANLPRSNQDNTEEDPYSSSFEDYKIPTNVTISKVEKPEWEPQFADIAKKKEKNKELSLILGSQKSSFVTENISVLHNLIVVGNPISRKECFVDTNLLHLLLHFSPQDIRFILNDTNHYLDLYEGIPHLLSPVISDYDKIRSALRWALSEIERRLKLFSSEGVRDLDKYNEIASSQKLPRVLNVVFLSWSDIEITDSLIRLTSVGPRAGIHNIIIVERFDNDVISKEIKANVPARMIYKMTSSSDSRSVGVKGGDELKPGEAIFKANSGQQMILKTIFTPDVNVKEVVEAIKKHI